MQIHGQQRMLRTYIHISFPHDLHSMLKIIPRQKLFHSILLCFGGKRTAGFKGNYRVRVFEHLTLNLTIHIYLHSICYVDTYIHNTRMIALYGTP